jgi:RNA polymerase sigma-70 factor (ECF subfamily)
MESTAELLGRARDGDRAAVEILSARYRLRLERWATGRLPRRARDLLDTDDLVQDVLIRTMRKVDGFSPRTMGGFTSYVRQALKNRIRDELRRVRRTPERIELDDAYEDPGLTPLEDAIGRDQAERYEAALLRLRDADREAVVARIEMRCSYEEIADLLKKPSANTARMTVVRALERLVREMSGANADAPGPSAPEVEP